MSNLKAIENKISSARKYSTILKRYRGFTKEKIRRNVDVRGAVERYLYLEAQAAIDLAEAVIAHNDFRKPTTMSEAFYILNEEKIISGKLTEKLVRMVGFRNVLAHDYEDIDYDIVYESTARRIKRYRGFSENHIKETEHRRSGKKGRGKELVMQPIDIKKTVASRLNSLPFKINAAILYGSFARGTATPDSDIDILFVSDEVNPRKHRRGKEIARIKERLSLGHPMDILLLTGKECISNFRNHNPIFLDIAWEGVVLFDENNFIKTLIDATRSYISEKNIKKLGDGWLFPVPERTPAFLSKVSNRDFALAMMHDGTRDFAIGLNIMEDGFYDKAVYHFQQSAEKAIKAVLICFGIFRKTHFIGEVLVKELESRRVIDVNWKEKLILIAKVSSEVEPEVTWSRYPGIDDDVLWIPSEEYTIEDTHSIKDKCEKVIKTAQAFLAWWFPADKK